MSFRSLLLFALTLLFATTSMAKICKVIAPDGSVTYTDTPTAECDTKEPAATPAAAHAAGKATAKSAPDAKSGAPTDSSADPVETAVVGVMRLEDKLRQTQEFCASVLPASGARLGEAGGKWRDRNAGALRQMRRAFADFDLPRQHRIAASVKQETRQSLATIATQPKNSQIRWCDQVADEIDGRTLDATENLTQPLQSYQ